MIGVLVPARNEAQCIGRCIEAVLHASLHPALEGEQVSVLVAADGCTDATASIARQAGAQVVEVAPPGGVGLARGTAAEILIARGARWLAMTDADSVVPADWLAVQLASRCEVFCGMVQVADWEGYGDIVASQFSALHPQQAGHAHVHGANLGLSSAAYRRCGGFLPLLTGEDRQLVERCHQLGLRIARSSAGIVETSARRQARAPAGFSDYLKALEQRLVTELHAPSSIAPAL